MFERYRTIRPGYEGGCKTTWRRADGLCSTRKCLQEDRGWLCRVLATLCMSLRRWRSHRWSSRQIPMRSKPTANPQPPPEPTLPPRLSRPVPSRPSLVPSSMSTSTLTTSRPSSTPSRSSSLVTREDDDLCSRSPSTWVRTRSEPLPWTVPMVSSEDRVSSTLVRRSRSPSDPPLLGELRVF